MFTKMKKWGLMSLAATTLLLAACGQETVKTSSNNASSTAQVRTTSTQQDGTDGDFFKSSDYDASYDETTASKITFSGTTATVSGNGVRVSGSIVTISEEGTYILSGTSENMQVIVAAADTAKVQLVLDNVTMKDATAPIYVQSADKVTLTLAEGSVNSISDSASSVNAELDAAIYSTSDLVLNGSGQLSVAGHSNNAIESNDDVRITGGTYTISAVGHGINANDALNITKASLDIQAGEDGLHADNDEDTSLGNLYISEATVTVSAGDDAIHASNSLVIDSGEVTVTQSTEGLEGTSVTINGGTVKVYATDDGINAASDLASAAVFVQITGGDIEVEVGQGDTDAIDSNGDIAISGGTIALIAQSGFDFDGVAEYTGGTITLNGQVQNEIVATGPGAGGFGSRP